LTGEWHETSDRRHTFLQDEMEQLVFGEDASEIFGEEWNLGHGSAIP
jgi:hypothetical protein